MTYRRRFLHPYLLSFRWQAIKGGPLPVICSVKTKTPIPHGEFDWTASVSSLPAFISSAAFWQEVALANDWCLPLPNRQLKILADWKIIVGAGGRQNGPLCGLSLRAFGLFFLMVVCPPNYLNYQKERESGWWGEKLPFLF